MERRAPRYTVWLPVTVEELEEGVAVGHDASARGIAMVTASRLHVGASVTVHLQLSPEAPSERVVKGHVVRVEQNTEDPDGLWPHRLAIEFEEADPEVGRALAALADRGIAKKKQ